METTAIINAIRAGLAGIQLLRSLGVAYAEVKDILEGEEITDEELQIRLEQRAKSIQDRIEGE